MSASDCSRRHVLKTLGGAAAASAFVHSSHAATPYSMPGLFPGRVIGVEHAGASVNLQYQTAPIQSMIRKGMMELTGGTSTAAAWRKLFQPGDVVGIKVNPNGIPTIRSSQATLNEILSGLLLAGISPRDIVICERNQSDLQQIAGWIPSWARTAWGSIAYSDDQTSITGYDPNHYVDLPGLLLGWQNASNPSHTRSHVALFVTRQVTKLISLSVLKDHQAAGVTLGLKNLSHGCCNNVNRSHPDLATNNIDIYSPNAVSIPILRNKTVLSIIDGVHGLYTSGPIGQPDFVWPHCTMYFATDVVAGDRIGWNAIDAKRASLQLPPEESAGVEAYDAFLVRKPQNITEAGKLGLGEWRNDHIDFRKFKLA
jgi:hypothetical protein